MTPPLGLRLRDLSDRSGITAGVIARLERGQVEPKPEAIGRLARALGVRPEELVEETARR
jgi:transcriptional regulator with XRE-family HTH domain